jgi:Multiubiquitin
MSDQELNPHGRQPQHRTINVDGKEFPVDDAVVAGRQVLEVAGRHPAEEYIVYWLGQDNVLEDLGLDRTVHLERQSVSLFFTFEADRSYRFEIEGKREDWGAPKITEETLRKIAGVGADFAIFVQAKDAPARRVERGEIVDLTLPGIERFYVERIIKVHVENEENGASFDLDGFEQTRLKTLFEEMYKKLGVVRQADDRLRCEEGGGDVFGFAELTLKEYIERGNCKCLVWLFAGGTGGASCR